MPPIAPRKKRAKNNARLIHNPPTPRFRIPHTKTAPPRCTGGGAAMLTASISDYSRTQRTEWAWAWEWGSAVRISVTSNASTINLAASDGSGVVVA